MAGQYGNLNKTIQNLTVLQINDVEDLLYVKGSVPGPKNGYLTVRDSIKSILPANALKPAGLKENKKTEINTPDQKETVQDDENKNKSENSEVINEELTDQKVNEQTFATVNGTSNKEVTDNNKILNNKEV